MRLDKRYASQITKRGRKIASKTRHFEIYQSVGLFFKYNR